MKTTLQSPGRTSALASLSAIPWCCVLPAALSLLSVTGVVAARVWLVKLAWILLPLGVVLLGRAHWLVVVRRQGRPWTRWVVWGATVLVLVLWLPRLWFWSH